MADVPRYQNYVNGAFVDSESGKWIPVENPATNKLVSEVPDSTRADARAAIDAAAAAQPGWERLPNIERAQYLHKLAQLFRDNADEIARTITEEQGKILGLATVEVHFTADYLDYMAEWARRIEGEIIPSDRGNETIFLFRKPIGVVTGILPWNFPFFLIARKMAPALVAGNTVVIKPSEVTPNNAYHYSRFVHEAGLPEGVYNIVNGFGASVGQELSSNAKVGMVSMTGSVETGAKIMAAASENIIKVNLELGGNAPAIVLGDADLELAVNAIKQSRVINTGQVCNCADRVYVDKRVADAFTERIAAAMAETRYGNPLQEDDLDMGPLVNQAQLEKVEAIVKRAVDAGCQLVTGGRRADRPSGYHYEPTVLTGCRQDMEIIQKEIFGPVLPIVPFSDLDEGIAFANDCQYGLTSSIYTKDIDVAMRACHEIRFGETYINRENFEAIQGFHAGWRKSGIGGADGKHGLYEYMQTHIVYIDHDVNKK